MNIDARLRRLEHALARAATHDGLIDVRDILLSEGWAAMRGADERAKAEGRELTDADLAEIIRTKNFRKALA